MSITYKQGYYTVSCDYCGDKLYPELSRYDARTARKCAGWICVYDGTCWTDYCKRCAYVDTLVPQEARR